MKRTTILCALLLMVFESVTNAELLLVENGEPRAEIVIDDSAFRSTRLAAQELQRGIEKISGAKLNIVSQPSGVMAVKLLVGESSHTKRLGITAAGLKEGAYRIATGSDWIVFIGDDTDFSPVEPWPRGNADIRSGKMQAAWNKITGEHWGYTHNQLYKHYSGSRALFGTPDEQHFDSNGNVNVWSYDERGSFNAVCGFLRQLGMRWYMPGSIGEIVPTTKTIKVAKVDRTERPDFPMRILNFRPAVYGRDAMMWSFRLGVRQPWGRQAAHGLHHMTHNEHTLTNHPDWFALYGGKRHTEQGQRLNQLCYSNSELLQQSVRFAQKQFDHYDMDVVSIMPPDGYTAICQCKLCQGKDDPQRGYRGALSDYVWNFVNEVAKKVAITHPDKRISNCAYGTYTLPPQNIDKLEPNIQVIIVGGRRPTNSNREELRQLRKEWSAKTDSPIEIFENYPFTSRGFYLPAYIPRALGESINETKGLSRGEDIWLSMDFGENAIGYNHFLIYFSARMYWGGTQSDAVKMFAEYCRRFYGPVGSEMKTFFEYCEQHWTEMEKDAEIADHALRLFSVAKGKTVAGSIYSQRIELIDNYLDGLRNKSVQLTQKRGPVPQVRLVGGEPLVPIVVDGKFDDAAWKKCAIASTGSFRELQTGNQPIFKTSFKTTWQKGSVYFAIRCDERAGEKLNIATTKNGDQAIWYGDAVEILLGTDSHSYYQIAVNPSGAIIDLDRGASRNNWFNWASKAEVATRIEEDHWTVEIRIPVIQDKNDPLHQVIGNKPTPSLPWHINVCRQRIRSTGSEHSAFAPTSKLSFHEPIKFGRLYSGQSREFAADATVSDYIIESRKADQLVRRKQYKEASAIYQSLAKDNETNKFQKSDALRQAIRCERSIRQFQQAEELAREIPVKPVAKIVEMENLLAQRSFEKVIENYGNEDLEQWPFTHVGSGAFLRAKAYAAKAATAKEIADDSFKKQAEADFLTALQYTSDSRVLSSIHVNLGGNREFHLRDDEAALVAYRKNFDGLDRIGSADQFRSVQGAARILTRQKRFDQALLVLQRTKIETLNGYWRNALLLSRGSTLAAAKRTNDALQTYRLIIANKSAASSHLAEAKKRIEELEGN